MDTAKTSSSLMLKLSILFFVISLITTIIVVGILVSRSSGKSCNYNGIIYNNGDTFMNECNNCTCDNGNIACTTMACNVEDEDIVYPEEQYEDEDIMKDLNPDVETL